MLELHTKLEVSHGGWEVYEFYSETKVCYVDYSGTLQRAQIDNYDD